ncbi:little elongation complex subunit 2 [Amphiprion ocellaris]|uniref:Little elongation complex subunit 2 C-terminal domain-containing protein n=1 Tax=Amphiprion ocellaris TaxID=80972 RepID=A0A3Q1AMR1_AMPOC|nr:little elongation complex subunit 2 [Amphiprion ocellaris]
MELVWEDDPVPEGPFFTRDLYDKYSLGPSVRELWAFLQSPEENANIKCDVEAAKASCSSSKEAAELKDNSCISSQVSCWETCDSEDPCADSAAENTKGWKDTKKVTQNKTKAILVYPEPRLPFPCMSSLSSNEQKIYVDFLTSKKPRHLPQNLQARVNHEVMQFTNYLQDVAKLCADDYNFIPQGAMQYSEEVLRNCLECMKTLPQLYQIHEMTSLTGGTFNPGLKLTFEKQLLSMGNVNRTNHGVVYVEAQLASDYQSVSSENPPAKKAKDMHATISNDGNAEKLCACYEPHVCLTRDALVRLLDNNGPDFADQWELPIWVKLNPGKGSRRKTVYIDSPLLKTEMTVRERSHIYHEESLKLSISSEGSKNVFHIMTELPVKEQQISPESSRRNLVSFEDNGLDFEVDLTDLETFGEKTTTKTLTPQKMENKQDGSVQSKKAVNEQLSNETKRLNEHLVSARSSSQEEMKSFLSRMHRSVTEPAQPAVSEKTEPVSQDSARETDEDLVVMGDSDDEKLVIDDSGSSASTPTKRPAAGPPVNPTSESATVISDSSSPHTGATCRPQPKKSKVTGDQLGEILRMQTAMFKSSTDAAKSCTKSPTRCVGSLVHPHPTSLVKPCVSSYLERNQNEDEETCAVPREASVVNNNTTEHKKLLSQDLQASAENEQDYEAPVDGNLFYKLYSLQDLLLMVRSSISYTYTGRVDTDTNRNEFVPVFILPKLEYQLSYGVECLTSSEACQLWTETLLHSSTVSHLAHIDAHTSKLALRRKVRDGWMQNTSCGLNPSKSLNILHHLLKKLTGLEEGQYLIVHKAGEPFVTIFKAADGKVSQVAYNLQQVHSSVPQPPTSGLIPWIPVNPAVVLDFHRKHNRVPCTFPPKPFLKTTKDGTPQSYNPGARQKNNFNAQGNAGHNQTKRTAKRKKYMKKLIQKSI